MPYQWTSQPNTPGQTLHLWAHQSLPAKGFALFIGITFTMILIPTLPLLGSVALWGLLPFCLMAVGGIYFALRRNNAARQIDEELTLTGELAQLVHTNASGDVKEWTCNQYWASANQYKTEGPVPYYITLQGNGREVEIGAFLSEDERILLYDELQSALKAAR